MVNVVMLIVWGPIISLLKYILVLIKNLLKTCYRKRYFNKKLKT